MSDLHKGDIGTAIQVTVTLEDGTTDISAATTRTIKVRRPDGTTASWTASFDTDGTDGVLTYTTIAGDLPQAGAWSGQAYLVFPTGTWHSEPFDFTVGEVIS